MTEEGFNKAFCDEFPDLKFLYDEWCHNDIMKTECDNLFSVYIVEAKFELVSEKNEYRGFNGEIYSFEDGDEYGKGNQYTFDFLKKIKT